MTIFLIGWILNFIALIVNFFGYLEAEKLLNIKKKDKRRDSHLMSIVDEEDFGKSWIVGAQDLNETAKTVGTFVKDVGWTNALNLIGLGVL